MGKATARALISSCATAVAVVGSMVTAVPAQADGDLGAAVLRQVNITRAANGCGPVASSPQLTAAAARHSRDMLATGVPSHTGSDGSSLAQRVTDAGYTPYAALGEVVYWSTAPSVSAAATVTAWMNSPGHRAIITDCALTDAGFSAVSDGGEMTATGDFGKR